MNGGTQIIERKSSVPGPDGPGSIRHAVEERTKGHVTDDEVLSEMKRRLLAMQSVRALHEGAWLINMAFYNGSQWSVYARATRQVVVPRQPQHRVRHTANVVARHIDRWVAKLTKNRPTVTVEPTTNTDADKSAARASNASLQHAFRVTDFDRKFRAMLKMAAVVGAGIGRPSWDWQAGEYKKERRFTLDEATATVLDLRTGTRIPLKDFRGNPAKVIEHPVGEVAFDLVSPFDFYWDVDAQSPFDCHRTIERAFLPIEEIAETWERGRDVVPKRDEKPDIADYGRRILADFEQKGLWDADSLGQSIRDRAVVYRYMEDPTPLRPKGRMIVWANEVLLDAGPLPWRLTRIPYVLVPCTTIPWRFWPRSLMDDLRRLQIERNKALSQDIEARNLTRWPKLLLPHGCGVRTDAWNSEAGEKIWYTAVGPHKPEMLTLGATQHNEGHILRCDSDMRDITAQHEVSSAQVPGGVRAASAIIALQEADDTILGPQAGELEAAAERVASTFLLLQTGNYVERRFLKIAGEINAPDVTALMGSDLKGSVDVRCVPGSAVPQSKYLKEERVLNLFREGLISDPRKALRLLDMHDTLDLYYGEGASRQIARQENLMLARGEWVDVAPEEDDHLHIEEHEQFMRERKFDQSIPPEAWATLREHVAEHYGSLMEKAPRLDLLAATGYGLANKFRPPGSSASDPGGGLGVPGPAPGAAPRGGFPAGGATRAGGAG